MNTNIDVVCYRSKTLSNGESPLMLRLTKEGKRKYVSLQISLNPDYWDFKRNKPRRHCPEKESINYRIETIVQKYREQVEIYKMERQEYTLETLVKKVENPVLKCTVGAFLERHVNKLIAEKRLGYARSFLELKASVLKFCKSLDFYFADMDITWLKDYELWMRKQENSANTMGIRMRSLRVLYNLAIEENLVNRSSYPFDKYKVSRLKEQTAKRALSKAEILKVIEFDVSQMKGHTHFLRQLSKDIFVFSYLCCGMNITDIAHLKNKNIAKARIAYKRQKTGKILSFSLPGLAGRIIDSYSRENPQPDDYVFPILNKQKHVTMEQQRDRIKRVTKWVNEILRQMGTILQFAIPLTTYVARHSFATVLKRSGVNVALISEALGHSDIATTQIYLDSFENSQIDEAIGNLL